MAVRSESRRILSEKLMASGGVATLTIAVVNIAEAGIVASTTAPISPPSTHGQTGWDVDGDGTDDFRVGNFNSTGELVRGDRKTGRIGPSGFRRPFSGMGAPPDDRSSTEFPRLSARFGTQGGLRGPACNLAKLAIWPSCMRCDMITSNGR